MFILIQFLLRLVFGLALAMAITSPRLVTSGYFRNHSYVLLGATFLAALAAWSRPEAGDAFLALAAAGLSYVSAAAWLYEKRRLGAAALLAVSAAALAGTWLGLARWEQSALGDNAAAGSAWLLAALDPVASGWLLGTVIAAMFLGHWYLNTPSMQLSPLRKLIVLAATAVGIRAAVSTAAIALLFYAPTAAELSFQSWTLLALRWGAGIIGTGIVLGMTWQTLKIPNTQSATGILYVGVIFTFLGELAGLLLSATAGRPL